MHDTVLPYARVRAHATPEPPFPVDSLLSMAFTRRCWGLFLLGAVALVLFPSPACGETEVRYIDDKYGDSVTGDLPVYASGGGGWSYGPECSGCFVEAYVGIDTSKAYMGSWEDLTQHTTDAEQATITIEFTGEHSTFSRLYVILMALCRDGGQRVLHRG
jgi:hypothetical protein